MKFCVHTGSYSIDNHTHTQAQTDAMVLAIVTALPSITHIAIGTYLDYASEFALWANSIHNYGKSVWYRSAGWNTWQGTNSAGATGSPTQHRADTFTTASTNWIHVNKAIFQAGDIFECVPDEPVEGAQGYYKRTYGSSGVVTNATSRSDFNTFIQGAIGDCNTALAAEGITGVFTGTLFDTPSVIRISGTPNPGVDILTTTTAGKLDHLGSDDYPETSTQAHPTQMYQAQLTEINTWINGMGVTNPHHYTFGPNINLQLEAGVQLETYRLQLFGIARTISPFDGVTLWQAGGTGNPLSRLFDYSSGTWTARPATQVINQYIQRLLAGYTFKRIPLV